LRKSAGFVGQIESFRGSLLIRDSGRVESFLGTTGVIDDELNGAGGTLAVPKRERIFTLASPRVFAMAATAPG